MDWLLERDYRVLSLRRRGNANERGNLGSLTLSSPRLELLLARVLFLLNRSACLLPNLRLLDEAVLLLLATVFDAYEVFVTFRAHVLVAAIVDLQGYFRRCEHLFA